MTNVGVYPAADVKTAGEQVSSGYEGRQLTFTEEELKHPAEDNGFVTKGDPVIFCLAGVEASFGIGVGVAMIGNSHLSGRAVTDLISVDTEGIWIQNVVATDDDGNSDVVPGDQIFIDVDTCILSKISSTLTNLPFGYALGRVTGGSDGDIAVKVHFDPPDNWIVDGEKLFFGDAKEAWFTPTGDKGYDGILAYAIWTVAGQTGRTFESQMLNNVLLGGYANALKGYMDCDESGGSTGLLSGINGEIRLPDAAGEGAYYALEGEVVLQENSRITPWGSSAGFLYLGASGHVDGVDDFDNDGRFMTIVGLTPEAGHLLSADYHTLKCAMVVAGVPYDKYLVMSIAENYLSHRFTAIADNDRIFKLQGDWATPNVPDGQGIIEIDISLTGTALGSINITSCWLNIGVAEGIALAGANLNLHHDGIWQGASGGPIAGAHIAWQRFTCDLTDNDYNDLSLFQLNFTQTITSIFDVNDQNVALGFRPGTNLGTDEVGTIPFCASAGGGIRYIYVYPNPAS